MLPVSQNYVSPSSIEQTDHLTSPNKGQFKYLATNTSPAEAVAKAGSDWRQSIQRFWFRWVALRKPKL